jgi:hypothetical protein
MKLLTVHPGVTVSQVEENTGFDLIIPDRVPETAAPTADEVRIIREEVDPLELRKLETLGGPERLRFIAEAYRNEVSR